MDTFAAVSENAAAGLRRRVLFLQLRVWLIAVVVLVIGVAIGLVLWIAAGSLKVP
jgi:hypothetical protein